MSQMYNKLLYFIISEVMHKITCQIVYIYLIFVILIRKSLKTPIEICTLEFSAQNYFLHKMLENVIFHLKECNKMLNLIFRNTIFLIYKDLKSTISSIYS